jgi:hypothetical protein
MFISTRPSAVTFFFKEQNGLDTFAQRKGEKFHPVRKKGLASFSSCRPSSCPPLAGIMHQSQALNRVGRPSSGGRSVGLFVSLTHLFSVSAGCCQSYVRLLPVLCQAANLATLHHSIIIATHCCIFNLSLSA